MKLKMKFDAQSIKEFFIRHTEKIVFGSMVLILGLLVYSAMGLESLSFQPDQLAQWAADAERHIQSTPAKSPRTPTDYLAVGTRIKTPIEEQLYQTNVVWDQPVFERKELRPGPPLLPLEELRVAAGHGSIPKIDTRTGMVDSGMSEMGMAGPRGPKGEGLRWAVLTGVIPDAKQRDEALTAFQGTELPSRDWDRRKDIPEVIYYKVERAEVVGEGDSQRQLPWTPLHVRNAMMQIQQFRSSTAQDVVDPRFIRNPPTAYLAFPLPPVVDQIWGEEVAHLPQIPMIQKTPYGMMPGETGMPMGEGMPMAPGATPAAPATSPTELPDAPLLDPRRTGFGPGMSSMEPGMGMDMGMGAEGVPSMIAPTPEMGYSPDGLPGSRDGMLQEPRVRLFRFFDFTVEPGKRYKYRVKLMFSNPNLGLPVRVLKSPELASLKYLEAEDWTVANEIVTVPRDSRVLAGPVKSSIWATVEPKGTLGVAFFDMKSGAEQFEEFKDVTRGQLLNIAGRPLQGTEPPPSAMPEMDMMAEMPPEMMEMYPGAKPPKKKAKKSKPAAEEKAETVDYITDTVLLDMCGGAKLPGRDRDSTEPGRYLLLDSDGSLVMQNELDFAEEYKALSEPPPKPASEMYPGMEGMPSDMMPGGIFETMPAEGGSRRKPAGRRPMAP
jgi:hypothetical protein